ncbi:MAG: ComF family protein [Candidatus Limnocylindrales bacterium]
MRALLDLLLPPTCPGCGREGTLLCATCARPLWRRLDEPPGSPLGLPTWLPAGILQLEWLAPFTGTTRAALHALKYRGARPLAEPLGTILAARWARAGRGGDLLVPVPIHQARLHERGYDQAVLLADVAGRRLGLPAVPALRRGAATVAQHGLGRGERSANVGHAFEVAPGRAPAVAGRWVILVDDILTTGATIGACAAALRSGGAAAVSALVVARER